MIYPEIVNEAARKFIKALGVEHDPECYVSDAPERQAFELARLAFAVYRKEWKPFPISEWRWPYDQLASGDFDTWEPWTVLFRGCVEVLDASRVPSERARILRGFDELITLWASEKTEKKIGPDGVSIALDALQEARALV